ncbi:WAS/WASL-interacting protein family member 2 isoform X1 [Numida meleagris]|uniref:WAS/WASL-interacting protein family member 2 isoform X1 n=1 Tax=Numida meleagris TaxID=8996 RepID=UPI000B3DC902|nr:WAS/WASL-interacting protein family member 2 isoform X1 [Numida meleagris]XP_021233846.1 WAS/WASL-interacting protein family member 2 isoform X1 [Numida meleagris]XP_021233847.1 WAS/WASL-interacting protein family member 2 isoform X1 [Numida meleagris]XP_021233848.1 WAS/WASL-interacting protein family member 2 isoform X1 [Numida meleagris]XP_021233849.1 WAS/WASL-interacting protein family member 2 isoform X1 [Numida meleagris]XP_021233850.1 WAS/WASL-interacting protein family member 2 isofo
MPIPPPPPPPPGPPPPPTFSQANTEPPKLSREEQRGRGALLQDICKGTKLKKVTQINDRSAPILEKPKGSGGSSYGSSSAAIPPKGGLFQGGVPKLRPVGAKDNSDSSGKQTLQVPSSRAAAPRPPVPASNSRPQDDSDNSRASPPELPRTQRPSLPDLSRPGTAGGTGMKHSSSAPPPPPPGRRATAPPAPPPAHGPKVSSYNREKPLPPTPGQRAPAGRDGPPAPPPVKPPPSPVSIRTGSGAQGQSLAPPPPPYRQPPGVPNGPSSPINESAPELPQRHNSLHRKTPGPLRGLAPPPPASASPSLQSSRPPPPARDPPSRGAGENSALLGPVVAGRRCPGSCWRWDAVRWSFLHGAVAIDIDPGVASGLSCSVGTPGCVWLFLSVVGCRLWLCSSSTRGHSVLLGREGSAGAAHCGFSPGLPKCHRGGDKQLQQNLRNAPAPFCELVLAP